MTGHLGRRPALDGLRGLAVIAVVLAHFELPGGYGSGGMVGVDVFFTLSGFLITTLLLEERGHTGRIDFAAFYRRRAARLLPALLLLLAVVTIAAALVEGVSGGTTSIAAATTLGYFTNWWIVAGHGAGALGHTWSLAVEEQFYLVWPLLLVVAARHGRRLTALVAVTGVLLAISLRVTACGAGSCVYRVYHSTDTRMDQLLLGVLLALAFRAGLVERLPTRVTHVAGWGALAGLAALTLSRTAWDARWYDEYGMTVTAGLAVAVIVAVLSDGTTPLARILASRQLTAVGLVSYGLYLWDGAVVVFLRDGTDLSAAPRAVITVVVIAVAAAASWRFVERPVLERARAATGLRAAADAAQAEQPVEDAERSAEVQAVK